MTTVTLERGIAFFEDGTEVGDISESLIKATPKMLEALEHTHVWLCEHFGDVNDGTMECLCNEVEAVLVEVRGEQE